MHLELYCVYNQTNECFLSLGATLSDGPFARFKQWLGLGPTRVDEGTWIQLQNGSSPLGFFSSRDLVYLDSAHRVVHAFESFPALRAFPLRPDAETLLALPAHSISSSRTQVGNQLLICAAGEMEHRLRNLLRAEAEKQKRTIAAEQDLHRASIHPQPDPLRPAAAVAYYAGDGKLAVRAIRDLNATGLYLVTRDRWPVGSEVEINMQPSGAVDDRTNVPVKVPMRVMRWGVDGVHLEFAGAPAETSDLGTLYIC
jgi:hypothetical protein